VILRLIGQAGAFAAVLEIRRGCRDHDKS